MMDTRVIDNEVAVRLRRARQGALLTAEDLAVRSGVSVATIRDLEAERLTDPSPGTLRLLGDALSACGMLGALGRTT